MKTSVKEIVLSSFFEVFKVGSTFTKGEIYRNAAKRLPGLLESTVGWIISNWLVNAGRIVEVGKGKYGAKIYRRAR